MVTSPEQVAKQLLARQGLSLVSISTLQSLWAGYGSICAVTARADTDEAAADVTRLLYNSENQRSKESDIPLILKFISPPRGRDEDEGHQRKILSYEVEQHFYAELAPKLSKDVRVAKCLVSTERNSEDVEGVLAMILADLRIEFPVAGGKREALQSVQVNAAIDWLGNFHRESKAWTPKEDRERFVLPPLEEAERRSTGRRGTKVWLNGGYTYLATRRKEYANLKRDTESEWSDAFCRPLQEFGCSIAEAVAEVLAPRGRPTESCLHGDVKSENLFTTKKGESVAFFDFQYVGLGLGVCDLAKLFTCSVPIDMLDDPAGEQLITVSDGELGLLRRYRRALGAEKAGGYSEEEFMRHWECALVDWCRFQASWGFWGNTEWLEGRVRSILADEGWHRWLKEELKGLEASAKT